MCIFHSPSSLKSAMGFYVVFQKDCPKGEKESLWTLSHIASTVSVVVGSQKAAALLFSVLGRAVAPFFLPWLLS